MRENESSVPTPCTPEALYRDFRDRIVKFIALKVQDEEAAKDITQDVFARILRYCARGNVCLQPRSFLYQAATNAVTDYYRQRMRHVAAVFSDFPAEAGSEHTVMLTCLGPLVESLPSPYREAVQWADIDQLPQSEIASRMGISLSGAKSRIQRGRQKLKEMMFSACHLERDGRGGLSRCDPRK